VGTAAGVNGLIPTSGAIRLSSFYGTSALVLVTTAFTSVYTTNAGAGITCQVFAGINQQLYPQWTTVGNNPASVSYVTIDGDTSGFGGIPYHYAAQATGGPGTGGSFFDTTTGTPNPTSTASKTKNLYAWSASSTLLATGVLTYTVYPTPEITGISASYSGGTVTVTFTTNGFVTEVFIEYDDTAVLGTNAYTTIISSSSVSGSSGSYSFTLVSGHYNRLRVTPGERINTGFASGPSKSVTISGAPQVIIANFVNNGNNTGLPPDTACALSIDFTTMGSPTGNFAYTVTVASGDAIINQYTSSASGNFTYPTPNNANINLAIPHGAGTITATITKAGWTTWTKTISYSADSSQNYSWVSQPTSINEGSAGTFQIQSSEHNATFGYLISTYGPDGGDRTSDFASLGGTFVTNSSGLGTFTITPTADSILEGAENFKLTVKYGQSSSGSYGFPRLISNTIVINDTSTPPVSILYGYYDTPGYQGWLGPSFENTVPTGATQCTLLIVGGGGGGGGAYSGGRGAGGGGGGAEAKVVTFAVTAGQSVAFDIAAGGLGGCTSGNASTYNGTDGGTTTFYVGGVAKATAIGGHGGFGSIYGGGASAYGGSGGAGAVQTDGFGQVNAQANGGGAGTGGYHDAGGAGSISGTGLSANAYGGDGGGTTYLYLATGAGVLSKYCGGGGGGGAVGGAGGGSSAFGGTGGGSSGRGGGGAGGNGGSGYSYYNVDANGSNGITYGSGGGGSASCVNQTTGGNGASGSVAFYFS